MAKSILQDDDSACFLCGRNGSADRLERHHIFGSANRKFSDADGLTVMLCGDECHRNGKMSAHRNRDVSDKLQEMATKAWINTYGGTIEDFRARYERIVPRRRK